MNKVLYKIELLILKFIPFVIALCYFINTVLSCINIDIPIISLIAGLSIIPFIFIYISSFVFKFCIYHRLPLYYVIINDSLAYYDIYFGIPINLKGYLMIQIILFFILILLVIILKFKLCKKH